MSKREDEVERCPLCKSPCECDEELGPEDVSRGWVVACTADGCPYIALGCSERCVRDRHHMRCALEIARSEVARITTALELASETVNTTASNVEKAMANAAQAARKETRAEVEVLTQQLADAETRVEAIRADRNAAVAQTDRFCERLNEADACTALGDTLFEASKSGRFAFGVSEVGSGKDTWGTIDRVACYVRERMGRDA